MNDCRIRRNSLNFDSISLQVDPDKGISLRFPRFIRIRDDKSAEDATSAQQVADMYSSQDQIKNQDKNANKNNEEDFY